MSYDLGLWMRATPKCPACGRCDKSERVFNIDPTYNIGGIVRYADRVAFPSKRKHGRSFGAIHRMTGEESLAWLKPVLGVLYSADHRAALKKLEPENGWGDLDGTRGVFEAMIAAAADNPTAVWSIMGDGDTPRYDDEAEFFGWTS